MGVDDIGGGSDGTHGGSSGDFVVDDDNDNDDDGSAAAADDDDDGDSDGDDYSKGAVDGDDDVYDGDNDNDGDIDGDGGDNGLFDCPFSLLIVVPLIRLPHTQDAADRSRLGASTFKLLNLAFSVCSVGTLGVRRACKLYLPSAVTGSGRSELSSALASSYYPPPFLRCASCPSAEGLLIHHQHP